MKSSALVVWISALVLALTAYGGLRVYRENKQRQEAETAHQMELAAKLAEGPKLTDFTLTERSGKEFHSQDMRGEVWVASIFFTACPSACLELNKSLAEVQTDERFRDVKFVSITCDPRNDTPAVLATYANRFAADRTRWLFCTGEQDYIERIGRDILQISVQGITHSDRAVIIDRSGKSRGGFVIANPRFLADRLNFEKKLLECLAEPRPDLTSSTAKNLTAAEESRAPEEKSSPAAEESHTTSLRSRGKAKDASLVAADNSPISKPTFNSTGSSLPAQEPRP